jgi:hypothetical protein
MEAAVEAVCAAARTALKVARTASPVHACARVADAGSWKSTLELRRDVVPPDGDGDSDDVRDGVSDREEELLLETDGETGDTVTEADTERVALTEADTEGDTVTEADTDGDTETEAATDGVCVTVTFDVTVAESDGDVDGAMETERDDDADADGDCVCDPETVGCTDKVAETDGAGDGEKAPPPANVTTVPVAPETAIRRMTLLLLSATSSALLPLMVATPYELANKALVPTPLA